MCEVTANHRPELCSQPVFASKYLLAAFAWQLRRDWAWQVWSVIPKKIPAGGFDAAAFAP
jgi:hypothetical protein